MLRQKCRFTCYSHYNKFTHSPTYWISPKWSDPYIQSFSTLSRAKNGVLNFIAVIFFARVQTVQKSFCVIIWRFTSHGVWNDTMLKTSTRCLHVTCIPVHLNSRKQE